MVNTLDDSRLSTVLDVKVQLSVRLGSCQMAMRDVLELQSGTGVQLGQRADDPVGLYSNDKLFALGEVEEKVAIKVTTMVGGPA